MRDLLNLAKSVLVWIVGKLSYVCFSRNFYGGNQTQWLIEWRNDAPFRFKKNGPMMPCCRHCIIVCPPYLLTVDQARSLFRPRRGRPNVWLV